MKKLVLFSSLFVLFVYFSPQAQGGGVLSCCCDDRPTSKGPPVKVTPDETDPLLTDLPSAPTVQSHSPSTHLPISGLKNVFFPSSLPPLQKDADGSQMSFSPLLDFIVYPSADIAASSTIRHFSEIKACPRPTTVDDFYEEVRLFSGLLRSKGSQIGQTQQSDDIIQMIEGQLLIKYLFYDGNSFIFKSEKDDDGQIISRRMGLLTSTGPIFVIQVPGSGEQ